MSHDNLTWMAKRTSKYLGMAANDTLVSYLPLSHSAAQMVDVWMAMSAGATVNFADRNALKGSLVNTLREVRPTFFLGVPRVFEKMMEKMQMLGKSAPAAKKMVATWAKKTGKIFFSYSFSIPKIRRKPYTLVLLKIEKETWFL